MFTRTHIYRGTENHHVMICIGNRVNAAVIPDNFEHVLIARDYDFAAYIC